MANGPWPSRRASSAATSSSGGSATITVARPWSHSHSRSLERALSEPAPVTQQLPAELPPQPHAGEHAPPEPVHAAPGPQLDAEREHVVAEQVPADLDRPRGRVDPLQARPRRGPPHAPAEGDPAPAA